MTAAGPVDSLPTRDGSEDLNLKNLPTVPITSSSSNLTTIPTTSSSSNLTTIPATANSSNLTTIPATSGKHTLKKTDSESLEPEKPDAVSQQDDLNSEPGPENPIVLSPTIGGLSSDTDLKPKKLYSEDNVEKGDDVVLSSMKADSSLKSEYSFTEKTATETEPIDLDSEPHFTENLLNDDCKSKFGLGIKRIFTRTIETLKCLIRRGFRLLDFLIIF